MDPTFRSTSQISYVAWNVGSVEKAWLHYEFPFSLNPSDKPDDTQTWKSNLSLYPVITEDQFQENSKKSWGNILGAAK